MFSISEVSLENAKIKLVSMEIMSINVYKLNYLRLERELEEL